uniref:ribonuclease H n=1 Tax=Rhipicephalus pulchellus TaxID=72859 RepID=L7LSY4_RHIPC
MLQLYRVLFIGFLRYSLPAISNTCKTNLRTIQSIQAQALKICLGLPRGASTAETIAIAQDYSITTHITVETMRTYLRQYARNPSHHLASLAAERPRTPFSATVYAHRASFTSGYAPAVKPVFPPWCLYLPQVRLTIPGLQKKSALPAPALKQLSLFFLHETYKNHVHIYTDGSTTVSSSGGAVVIPAREITLRLKTSHVTTSTAAELTALRCALEYIDSERPSRWAVFSDSKPALQCVRSVLRRGCHEQLTYEIVRLHHRVKEKGHEVDFQWIPGHCGISGNVSADNAARTSHEQETTVPIPLSRTDAASQLRHLARSLCLAEWNTPSIRHTRLHQINPTLELRPPAGLHRREASLLCRLWLGVAFTKAYTTLIGVTDSSVCEVCGTEEDIDHLLCRCPRFASERRTLSAVMRRLDDRPLSVQMLLEHRPHRSSANKAVKALLCFLRTTGLCERL